MFGASCTSSPTPWPRPWKKSSSSVSPIGTAALGPVAAGLDRVARGLPHLRPFTPVRIASVARFTRLANRRVHVPQQLGRLAEAERARHVGAEPALGMRREDVDDQRLARPHRARAELVHERPLRAGARDRRLALAAVRAKRRDHLGPDALGRQLLALEHEAVALRRRRAEDLDDAAPSRPRWRAAAARIPASACSSLTRRRSWNCSRSGVTATPLPRRWSAATTGNDGGTTTSLRPSSSTTRPSDLDLGVVPAHPARDELASAELGAEQHVGGAGVAAGGVGLDLARHDQALTVRLDVDERVDDRDAGGEKQVGVAEGIGEHEQSCGHADKLSPDRW